MLLYVSETLVKQSETSETISNDQHLKVSKHRKATSILMLQLLQLVTKMLQPQSRINTNCYKCYKKNNVFIIYILYYFFLFLSYYLYYLLFSIGEI
jgi:hypothetical protein